MPPKKKPATTRNSGKPSAIKPIATKREMTKPSTRRDRNDERSVRRPVALLASTGAGTGAADARTAVQTQLKFFEQAIRVFHAQKFREASELFAKATDGPNREMAHKAQLHIRMCGRRLQTLPVELKTADDHYNYAVALINGRNMSAAQQHLESALKMDPGADHVHYALALSRGLSGDLQGAYENLRRAIELQPRNRMSARQDADFASFSRLPPLRQLLFPGKTDPSHTREVSLDGCGAQEFRPQGAQRLLFFQFFDCDRIRRILVFGWEQTCAFCLTALESRRPTNREFTTSGSVPTRHYSLG